MSVEVRPMEERDRDRIVAIHRQAFQVPEFRLVRQRTLPLDRGWVITENGVVVGGLRVETVGQYFGGRVVPSAVITAVKLAAEARGKGLGGKLIGEVVRALAAQGIALSTLYPSSPALYRRRVMKSPGCTFATGSPRPPSPGSSARCSNPGKTRPTPRSGQPIAPLPSAMRV